MFWPTVPHAMPAPLRRLNIYLRRALGAHAPHMVLALALPAASMLLGESARDLYLMALEACIALGTICHLLVAKQPLGRSKRALHWALLLAGLGGADLIYNGPGPLVPRYPRNHVADVALLLVVASLTVMALRGWQRRHGPWGTAALWLLAMGTLQLQVTFVLQPLMHLEEVPTLALLNAWCYAGFSSMLLALLVSRSSCAVVQEEHLACQGLLLMLASDFAQRHDAQLTSGAMGWGEAGWAAGLGLLAVALSRGRGELPWRATSPHAPLRSARCTLGALTFMGNMVLLGGALVGGLLQITEGAQLTALLWLLWIGWFVSNLLAVRLYEAMERIGALMPAPQITWCHAQHPMTVALKPITPRIRLAEFDGWVARYNQLVRQLNPIIAQVSRHQEAYAYQQMAEHVAHDIRAPVAALDSALDALGDREAQSAHMLRQAAARIREVAQALLRARRHQDHLSPSHAQALLPQPPSQLGGLAHASAQEVTSLDRVFELLQRDLMLRHGQAWAEAVHLDSSSLWVRASLTGLVTVLCNLVDNSIEALPSGPAFGAVRVKVRRHEQGVRVQVIDRGAGMPKHVLQALGHRSITSGKRDGNGLGVLGAAQWVQAFGTKLRYSLPITGGTTAQFDLQEVAALDAAQADEPSQRQPRAVQLGHTVLVDDDPLVRAAWQLSAQHAKAPLSVFATSAACLAALSRVPPQATFYLDTQLGGDMTGHDLARALIGRGFTQVIVMQSAGGGGRGANVVAGADYPIRTSKRAPFAQASQAA